MTGYPRCQWRCSEERYCHHRGVECPLNSNPRRRENSGKAPIGTQNLAVNPPTMGTRKE
jgi:hypothetical protein